MKKNEWILLSQVNLNEASNACVQRIFQRRQVDWKDRGATTMWWIVSGVRVLRPPAWTSTTIQAHKTYPTNALLLLQCQCRCLKAGPASQPLKFNKSSIIQDKSVKILFVRFVLQLWQLRLSLGKLRFMRQGGVREELVVEEVWAPSGGKTEKNNHRHTTATATW